MAKSGICIRCNLDVTNCGFTQEDIKQLLGKKVKTLDLEQKDLKLHYIPSKLKASELLKMRRTHKNTATDPVNLLASLLACRVIENTVVLTSNNELNNDSFMTILGKILNMVTNNPTKYMFIAKDARITELFKSFNMEAFKKSLNLNAKKESSTEVKDIVSKVRSVKETKPENV